LGIVAMEKISSLSSSLISPAARQPTRNAKAAALVALNFRVPLEVRRRLKILAASQSVTMTQLLLQMLEKSGKSEEFLTMKD
jgi:predicted HicB family RNase H-like nuclease